MRVLQPLRTHCQLKRVWVNERLVGKQNVGYEMVVDGLGRFQALNFGISGPEI